MSTHCFIPILGKRIRVTALDNCGNPGDPGTENGYIATDGFISVKLSSEVEDGAEIITKKADGSLCVNEKQSDMFKRFTAEIEFCGVNPSLASMVSNAEPYLDAAQDVAGFTVAEGNIDKKFSLEVWTGLSGAACEPGAEEAGGYLLLPFVVAGTIGDIEITGEDAITFSMTGASTKGGNAWGTGPDGYDVVFNEEDPPVAGPLPTALDPLDHLLMIDTGVAPPPSNCDPQPMPEVVNPNQAQTTTTGNGLSLTGSPETSLAETDDSAGRGHSPEGAEDSGIGGGDPTEDEEQGSPDSPTE